MLVRTLLLALLAVSPLKAEPENPYLSEIVLDEDGQETKVYSYKREFIKMILCLGAVVGLVIVSAYWLKKLNRGRHALFNQSASIRIIERRALSPKTALFLVEVEEKRFLVGDSPQGVNPLWEVPFSADSIEEPNESTFAKIFRSKVGSKK